MKWQLFRKNRERDKFKVLESKLDSVLKPVQPREGFVQDLRNQLVGKSEKQFLGLKVRSPEFALVMAGGVLSSFVLLLTGVRAVLAILGALGIIQQVNKKIEAEAPLPSPKLT